jgi:hypothetical protein
VTVSLLKAPAGFPAPSDYPELFYRCKIGGVLMPGVIPPNGISGWSLVTDHDVKKGKGADDATSTDTGDPPPKGTVKTQLWRKGVNDRGEDDPNVPHDFEEWDGFVKMLRQARRAKKALDIVHPIINQLEVTSVYVTKIGQITDEGKGLWTAELELEKWAPEPKDAGGTADSSDSTMGGAFKNLEGGIDGGDDETMSPEQQAVWAQVGADGQKFADRANKDFSDKATDE